MTDVITFFFQIWTQTFNTIKSYWLLSLAFLITVFGWIVGIINNTKSDK